MFFLGGVVCFCFFKKKEKNMSERCTGKNKNGSQCSRKVQNGILCFQHAPKKGNLKKTQTPKTTTQPEVEKLREKMRNAKGPFSREERWQRSVMGIE
jgi:hypothetical protein